MRQIDGDSITKKHHMNRTTWPLRRVKRKHPIKWGNDNIKRQGLKQRCRPNLGQARDNFHLLVTHPLGKGSGYLPAYSKNNPQLTPPGQTSQQLANFLGHSDQAPITAWVQVK